MAEFVPSQKYASDFNKAKKYENGDAVQAETVNNLIEGQLFVQGIASNRPIIQYTDTDTPDIFFDTKDGLPRFVFQNIKGKKGDQGATMRFVDGALSVSSYMGNSLNLGIGHILNPQNISVGDIVFDPYFTEGGNGYLCMWEVTQVHTNNSVDLKGLGYVYAPKGADGKTPYIDGGDWYIDEVYQGRAEGFSPTIEVEDKGDGEHWIYITDVNTAGTPDPIKIKEGKDGVGIKSIDQTTANTGSSEINTITIYNDNNNPIGSFNIYNGAKGASVNKVKSTPVENGTQVDVYLDTNISTPETSFIVNDGNDGISPVISVAKQNGVTTITMTDINGSKTANINDGENGVSVTSIKQTATSTSSGGVNKITATLSNGTTSEFQIMNGAKGQDGEDGKDGKSPTISVNPMADGAGNELEITNPDLSVTRVEILNGEKGDEGVGVSSSLIEYTTSQSGTTVPTSGWGVKVPTVSKGQFLWTKITLNFSNGTTQTAYNVSYHGTDANITIDNALSSTSQNAVQNKVVTTALNTKVPTTTTVNGHPLSSNVTVTKSDVGLSNVANESPATIRAGLTDTNVKNALGYTPTSPSDLAELNKTLSLAISTLDEDITDIKTGEVVVKKAENDSNGNEIINTYATKSEANARAKTIEYSWESVGADGVNPFKLNLTLKDANGNQLSTTQIDFPLEQMVVGAEYDKDTKDLILYTTDGQVAIPVDDIFDGLVTDSNIGDKTAGKAKVLETARTITFSGDVTGSYAFNGSDDKSVTLTVKDDSHNHVISNIDGLQTVLDGKVDKVDGKSLSTNDYTTAEKNKLAGISSGAEVNQNAFSNVKVGATTISADSETDTIEFVGSNVTITPDATNDKITFIVADGTTSAKGVVKLENSTSSTSTTTAATPNSVKLAYDEASKATEIATDAYNLADGKPDNLTDLGVTATATELNFVDGVTSSIQIQLDAKASKSVATTTSNGLMSSADKVKLNGIEEGATKTDVDTALSSTSSNPVQNKVVTNALNGKVSNTTTVNGHALSSNVTVTKSDVGLGNVENKSSETIRGEITKSNVTTALGYTPPTLTEVQNDTDGRIDTFSSTLHNVATSGNYNDLSNKPTIPTVNNGTLTIQKNGTTVKTFTANSSSNVTANITVPTKVSELTNDSGYKTTDNNTTYTLTKSGTTITLTGSDGKTSSVTDADTNTTYEEATTSSAGLMSAKDKLKLNGITAGATANVGTITGVSLNGTSVATSGVANITVSKSTVGLGNVANTGDSATPVANGTTKFTTGGAYTELAKKVDKSTTVNGHALSGDVTVTASDVGLGNVENKSSATIRGEIIKADVTTALGYTPLTPQQVYDDTDNRIETYANNNIVGVYAEKKNAVYYVEGTGTTTGVWLGTNNEISSYYNGLTIAYKVGIAGADNLTLNINSLGAKSVVRNASSAVTTHYGVGSVVLLVYTTDDGTSYWKVADYDSDTKTRSSNKASTKMYVIGAQNQSTSGQTTYSNSKVYIGTDNCLYSNGSKVGLASDITTNATNISNLTTTVGTKADKSALDTTNATVVSHTNVLNDLEPRVGATEEAIATLNGNSTVTGSVDQKISSAINDFANSATANGTIDTFKELVDYVAEHGSEVEEITGDITDLKGRMSTAETNIGKKANQTSLDTTNTNVSNLSTTVTNLSNNKADKSSLSAYALKTTVESLSGDVSSHNTRFDEIEKRATSIETDITNNVKPSITGVTNRVASVEDRATALESGKVDKVTGKGLSTNDYTTTEKNKLSGIASGAEVNQNAFSNVKVGATTISADSKTDTIELVNGSNITITPDATNDKVTIAVSSDFANRVSTLENDIAKINSIEQSITNIVDGTQIVGKATKDASGNNIVDTYATKSALAQTNGNLATLEDRVDGYDAEIGQLQDEKLDKSGGTMTGEIAIGQGDGNGIQLGKSGYINATNNDGSNTKCTLLGANALNALVGHSQFDLQMRGKSSAPTYNDQTVIHSGNYGSYALPLTGGTLSGSLILQNVAGGESPSLIFRRGEYSDTKTDWRMFGNNGNLYFGYANGSGWTNSVYIKDATNTIVGNLEGNASSATKINNYYSSRPTSANLTVVGDGSLKTFKSTSSMTTGKPTGYGDSTTGVGDAHIMHFEWDNTGGYSGQIALGTGVADGMQFRQMRAGTWDAWVRLVDSNNFKEYIAKYLNETYFTKGY